MPERIYRFDLIGEIWTGASGVVYWAWDTARSTKVCLYEWVTTPDQFGVLQQRLEKLTGAIQQDVEAFACSPKLYFVAPDLETADAVLKTLQSEKLFVGLPLWAMTPPTASDATPTGSEKEEPSFERTLATQVRRGRPFLMVLILLFVLLIGGALLYFLSGQHETALARSAAPTFRLSGSNTIGAKLAEDLVEGWLKSKRARDIHRAEQAKDETVVTGVLSVSAVVVQIHAHGSATAFEDLGTKNADLGMASRRINTAEAAALKSKGLGDLTEAASERVIGLDGVAIIVNEASGIETLRIDQIAAIFSGGDSTRSWNIYALDKNSGTYDTFKDRVLGTRALAPGAQRFEAGRELVAAVARDTNGIGFVGLPYAVGVKVVAVSEKGAPPLVGNTTAVRTEAYALARRLYFYVPEKSSLAAKEFVRFVLSPEGQDIVEADGFVGQKIDIVKQTIPTYAPKAYMALVTTADRLSVDFRFRAGSSELDTKALDDVKRIVDSMAREFAGRSLMLVGFADNTGKLNENWLLSKTRAGTAADQMKREGVDPVLVTGFGGELPVGDNSTADGREKNRRVEVWLSR